MQAYIEKLKTQYVPEQRTPEWYAMRKTTIGGSEIHSIVSDTYSSLRSFISGKISDNRFDGNLATRWGVIFEPITNELSEYLFSPTTPIAEIGSVPNRQIEGQRYSPDGLAEVWLRDDSGTVKLCIILFEYKAPISRIPLPHKSPPIQYMSQIQTGLHTIDVCDAAIFVDAVYRKCTLDDLNFDSTYDAVFHDKDTTRRGMQYDTVYALGMLMFYQTKETTLKFAECEPDTDEDIRQMRIALGESVGPPCTADEYFVHSELAKEPLDLGDCDSTTLDRVFRAYTAGNIKCKYLHPVYNDAAINNMRIMSEHPHLRHEPCVIDTELDRLQSDTDLAVDAILEEGHLLAILPWKLMFIEAVIVKHNTDWWNQTVPKIKNALEKLRIVNEADDPTAVLNEILPVKEQKHTYDADDLASMIALVNM